VMARKGVLAERSDNMKRNLDERGGNGEILEC
jgi:hypothetical protein